MKDMIELPNGDSIRPHAVIAIRLGDPRPTGSNKYDSELKPRVILDILVGNHGNCGVLDCASVEERSQLAKLIRSQCNEVAP